MHCAGSERALKRYLTVHDQPLPFSVALSSLDVISAGEHPPECSGVVCLDPFDAYKSALLARKVGVPYPSPVAVLRTLHRGVLRTCLWNAGMIQSPWSVCASSQQIKDFGHKYGYTLAVSPLMAWQEDTPYLIRGPEETDTAWAWAESWGYGTPLLVTPQAKGRRLCVHMVSSIVGEHRVLAISDVLREQEADTTVTYYLLPPSLSRDEELLVCWTARQCLCILGYESGPSHVELSLDGQTVEVHNVSSCLGPSELCDAIHLFTGIDYGAILSGALDNKSRGPRAAAAGAGFVRTRPSWNSTAGERATRVEAALRKNREIRDQPSPRSRFFMASAATRPDVEFLLRETAKHCWPSPLGC